MTPVLSVLAAAVRRAVFKDAENGDVPQSRWELRERLASGWEPATPAQRAGVHRLVEQHNGALVRSRPDGTAEVLTGRRGRFVRYAVTDAGVATVVERHPSGGTYRAVWLIACGGFAAFGLGLFVLVPLTGVTWLGIVVGLLGLAVAGLALVGLGAENGEHGALLRTRTGERWTPLGYPRD